MQPGGEAFDDRPGAERKTLDLHDRRRIDKPALPLTVVSGVSRLVSVIWCHLLSLSAPPPVLADDIKTSADGKAGARIKMPRHHRNVILLLIVHKHEEV